MFAVSATEEPPVMVSERKSIGEQNYEQFADRYAAAVSTKAHNAYYERPAMLSLLPHVRGLRVLDAGCGSGIYSQWLIEHGASVLGLDVTPRMVEIARDAVHQAQFMVAELGKPLPLGNSLFDLAICPLVLDYIADWGSTFSEFHRVLKASGVLVFSCGHPMNDYELTQQRGLTQGTYFDVEAYSLRWRGFGEPTPLITSYRRPLTEIFNPLIRAGFTLDTVLEPRPVEQFKEADPEDYEKLMKSPGFLCIRANRRAKD